MERLPHLYRVEASARPEGPVALDSSGLETLSTAPPVQYDGPGDRWSPETLFIGAVVDCFALTFRAVAGASSFGSSLTPVRGGSSSGSDPSPAAGGDGPSAPPRDHTADRRSTICGDWSLDTLRDEVERRVRDVDGVMSEAIAVALLEDDDGGGGGGGGGPDLDWAGGSSSSDEIEATCLYLAGMGGCPTDASMSG